jgi:hypothetical protein
MNKRQGTSFNFDVKKSRIERVCDPTNSDSSTSSLQSDLQDVQKEGKTSSTPVSGWTAIYNLVAYNALILTSCHELNVSFVVLFWEMKL